jgi:hypothetical protein
MRLTIILLALALSGCVSYHRQTVTSWGTGAACSDGRVNGKRAQLCEDCAECTETHCMVQGFDGFWKRCPRTK